MFKVVPGNNKIPLFEGWQKAATNDPNQLESWRQFYANRMEHWLIPTGRINGILVLDVDVKDANGFQTLQDNGYFLPQTLSQRTQSGGAHYIFKYPNDGLHYGNRVKFAPGLDTRCDGGYIVHYQLDSTPIAEAPAWLLTAIQKKTFEQVGKNSIQFAPTIANTIINDALNKIRGATEGERNDTLNKEAFRVGQLVASGSFTKEFAEQALTEASRICDLDQKESASTIQSGLINGMAKPVTSPFGDEAPRIQIDIPPPPEPEKWTPDKFSANDLFNESLLKKPQLFKNWSTEDITITTADGGTGKTTLKLFEAICLALGERFLGFECVQKGRTLYITGEDTKGKLGAMVGIILKQMGRIHEVEKVCDNIFVKKTDLCLITKDKQGFIHPNTQAFDQIMQAVKEIQPKLIVFDPIASFWGSEAALNDMAKAVTKFMSRLVEESNACVEMINHMGKSSSSNKDMTQFAGRGGTGLPNQARVSRVLRYLDDAEYSELTKEQLSENQSAMMCNVNKFSDGSPLLNKPFVIVREGFLFKRVQLKPEQQREEKQKTDDRQRVFEFIRDERAANRYPSKKVIYGYFSTHFDKISENRVKHSLAMIMYHGFMGYKVKEIENPDIEVGGKVFVLTDMKGKEL